MNKTSKPALEKIILGLVLLLANLRALVFIFLFPDPSTVLGPAWIEIFLWLLAGAGVLYLLQRDGQMGECLAIWRRSWPVAVFVLLAFLSLFWSIGPVATLFRSLELFFATLVASYFGMRLGPRQMMESLFWFGAVLLILSIALVYGAPPTGTMYWAPFNVAWRGVYWHRNHLAAIVALLNIVYLVRLLIAFRERSSRGMLDGFFYLFSLAVVLFTRSAAGYILLIVLHGFLAAVLLWQKISHRLTRAHTFTVLGFGLLAAVLVLANRGFVFGLFGRDATMTGRTGLWSHLLEIAGRHPWLGHGFGAYWTFDGNREEIRQLAGWTSQPLIGDNGLLDVYLHLGVVGVLVFASLLVWITVRAIRFALAQKTLDGFLPLLVMVYAFFANISFSLFAETEVFVWFLIVAVLFMTMQSTGRNKSIGSERP
jgi:O-antigen ligase